MFRKTDLTTLFFIQGNVALSLSCICIKLMCNVKINHMKNCLHVVLIVCFIDKFGKILRLGLVLIYNLQKIFFYLSKYIVCAVQYFCQRCLWFHY